MSGYLTRLARLAAGTTFDALAPAIVAAARAVTLSHLQGILATHLLACGYTAVHDASSEVYAPSSATASTPPRSWRA